MNVRPHPRHAIALLAVALCWSGAAAAAAASSEAKAAYVQAKDSAAAIYKTARAQCDAITGNPKDVCIEEAKAARVRAEEEAGAYYKNTLKAYTASRMKIASANYDLDKAKCGALAGNDKDVCVSQAKATLVATQADAKADRKAIEARSDARDDKRTAQYKVALEKCDAFAGAAKDSCVAAAKTQFGK
ncbi:MAG: hypothetical protein QFF03_12690 [Pseudomonadota bacterium]|nr:hypothetical protein [Pseudomonadota bacterium]